MSKRKNKCCGKPFGQHNKGCFYQTHRPSGILKSEYKDRLAVALREDENPWPPQSWYLGGASGDITSGIQVPATTLELVTPETYLHPPTFNTRTHFCFNGHWEYKWHVQKTSTTHR